MASRRITSKEEDGYLLEEEQRSSPKSPSHPPKNSMVVCVVFFNVLAAHARSLTLHVWKTAPKKEFLLHMILPLLILVMIPLLVLQHVPSTHVGSQINIVWTALLHFSTWPIVLLCGGVVVHHYSTPTPPTKSLVFKTCLLIALLAVSIIVNCQIQVIYPSWIWNPFLWGRRYPIYLPSALLPAMQGICLTQDPNNNAHPLCLKESSWKTLSAGVLSSKRKQDVEAVTRGIAYAREESGGLVVNVMSRDTVDAIPALQQNVEALVPFFQKVTVVVFENDSADGSREAFSEWSSRASGYAVDVMDCGPDNFDCKFGISHRYDAKEASHYFQSSAIGKMADYRQRMVDHILEKYPTYSHMIVVDLDLKVSLSPFGILHSLGTHPEAAVASSGRQVWPGSMGTLIPPYDFSAFRTSLPVSQKDEHLHKLHDAFCGLLPQGDRWRNQCDAASSIHLLFVLQHDVLLKEEPYKVASAFNGATLYPINVMKQTHAKYDTGEDGQRCEHIGFNLAFPSFYINPKWNFHVMPTNPGGPTGLRSVKNVVRIVFKPKLSLIIFAQLMVFLVAFVVSCMVIWNHLAQVVIAVALASWKSMKQTEEMELPMTLAHVHVQQDDYKKLKTVHKRNHSSPKSSPGRA